ncbi:sigma-70 family RNA polymerase sigma factor [Aggregatilinea lenta]|uniref:sigma-70 family RNA polymerase sigma factor n=1 Tax=Aggregatilinea lenta TaxID=913108 RepID=UPI000E5B6CBF|nr:sigma-70 family RNA polymerase sigma factor [Aggregatilinea lenta]
MDEQSLIQAALRGDVESFNTLVLAYQDMAYSVAYRVMGERDAAADAAQDAFISAFKKLDQFRGDQFKAWLMRIVTNACYDELRRRKRRPAASLDTLQDEAPQAELGLVDDAETPEQRLQRAELNQAIQDCLTGLPTDQRVVAVLADVEGYAYQEIADITNSSLGTVKSRLSRARTRLRDCLQGAQELLPAKYRLINEE